MNTFKEKIAALNKHIEEIYNWVLIFQGKEYSPDGLTEKCVFWDVHENLVFGGRVEMYGFGKIYKRKKSLPKDGGRCGMEFITRTARMPVYP